MMEKMIVTKYGIVIDLDNVGSIVRKTVMIMDDDEKRIAPFAVFAVMKNSEIVNIGNFTDYNVAEIIEILLDIFAGDNKHIFIVNLEEYGIKSFLELLKYVTERYYPTAVKGLKESLINGELDVSFS